MQTKLTLAYKLATTILTAKARKAGLAYNVQAHVTHLAQAGGLPCYTATGQAVALNILHNCNFNYGALPIAFNKLYNYFNNLHLSNAFMVKVTPT